MTLAVTTEILRNRIASCMEEMHHHLYRSGYSTIVRESRDFSCVLLTADGDLVVAPPMFFHATVYRHLVRRILAVYGKDGLAEGDVIVCNHPYEGGLPHVSDMAVVAPAFEDGELVGFSGSIAHKSDVGGTVPGSVYGQATEIYQEGVLVPPVKLIDGGVRNHDIARMLAANSRTPDLVVADLDAQVGVTRMGADRLALLCRRFGRATVAGAAAAIMAAGTERLAAAIARLPEGSHAAAGCLDSDGVVAGRPVTLAVRVTVKDGRIGFDLTGSAPQTQGAVNLRPSMIEAVCFYALIGLVDPELPFGDGLRDLVDFRLPEDSVVNARPPASVSSYMMTCHRLVDVVIEALGPFRPERAAAHAGGSGGALTLAWRDAAGRRIGNQYELLGSAYGAGPGHDGASAVSVHLANLHAAPIEIIESEYPCRIVAHELIAGSGGAGAWRGGLGVRRRYRALAPATAIYRADRALYPPRGLAGGGDGRPGRLTIVRGGAARRLPSSVRFEVEPGDEFAVESAGGGGYGNPDRRDPAALRRDLADGYVPRECAGMASDNAQAAKGGKQ